MNIVKGSIVKAKSGRDKGGFFVVLDKDESFAVIADGRRRTLQAPKRKNLKHLEATKTVIEGSFETNPQIRRILSKFTQNGG
jgi:ribosomal protein L14E/L6E/L27E